MDAGVRLSRTTGGAPVTRNGFLRAGGRPAWAAALLATAALAACAAYRPEPLQGEADRILAMPDLRIAGPGGTRPWTSRSR